MYLYSNLQQLNRISKVKLHGNKYTRLPNFLISNTWTSLYIFFNFHVCIQLHGYIKAHIVFTVLHSESPKLQSDHFILNLIILIKNKNL